METSGDLLSESPQHISTAQAQTMIWQKNSWKATCSLTMGLPLWTKAKPIGIPALISFYHKLAQDNPWVRELKASVDYGQVMPNVPQMGRFFSSLGAALQLAVNGRLSPRNALLEAEANMLDR